MKQALAGGAAARRGGASAGRRRRSTATITQTIAGTRLDISATGEVTRVPDVAIISAGVVTRSADRERRDRRRMRADGAGARGAEARRDRRPRHPDQQLSLNPEYRYAEEPAAAADRLYRVEPGDASASATSRNAGKILDALVARGRQPDQRAQPDHRQARSGARRGAGARRSPTAARAPSSMRARWACGSCGSSRSAKAADYPAPPPMP